MKAVHFGAGNIGRGFIGKLLHDSGYFVTFVDVNQQVIDTLATQGYYHVKTVGDHEEITKVDQVTGIAFAQEAAVDAAIAEASVVTCAVGPTVLPKLAPVLARALTARCQAGITQALNIIACENAVRATSQLKDYVLELLTPEVKEYVAAHVGFVDSAVDRIVPPVASDHFDPLLVTVEEFSEWIVDQTQFNGVIPTITGMTTTDNLMAYIERKLFTLNTGHACCAYFGKLAGYKLIREAIADPAIKAQVQTAMEESGAVLIARYGFDAQAHAAYIQKILKRFANPYLPDEVDRVGREPLRKLSWNDRLIKPLRGTLEYGTANQVLLRAIGAALCYRNEQDAQAVELAQALATTDVAQVIAKYTQLEDAALIAQIVGYYREYAA